jgi:hypothetical protein
MTQHFHAKKRIVFKMFSKMEKVAVKQKNKIFSENKFMIKCMHVYVLLRLKS